MLQKIHEKVQGLIAWIMVIFVAVTFTLWGIDYYLEARSHSSSDTVAEVDGEAIYSDAFRNAYQRIKRSEEEKQGASFNLTAAVEQQLKHQTLNMLVLNQVILQAAQQAGFRISPKQAIAALTQYPQFQQNGQFSQDKFRQAISSALYTPESFLEQIRHGMTINQQHFAFVGTAFAMPNDLDNFVKLFNQYRDFSYIMINPHSFKNKVVLTDAQLQQYYQDNKTHFKTPEQVQIQYIELARASLQSQLTVSDQEIESYYNDNIDNYTKPAQWQLAHILIKLPDGATQQQQDGAASKAAKVMQQLHNGVKFAELAKKYSDDVLSATNGGTMPPISTGVFSSQFDDAMLNLKQQGQFSAPIKTIYGYEIISLVSYIAPQQIAFVAVKNQIANTLKNDKSQQLFATDSDQLTDITYRNPDSLVEAAAQLNLQIKESSLFSKSGLPAGIASNKKVVLAAYSDDVLNQKNNSQPLQINDDTLVVLRVKTHVLPQIIAFPQMKNKITQILTLTQQQQQVKTFGEAMLHHLISNKPINGMLAQIQTSWQSQHNAKRNTENNSLIYQLAFGLPHPRSGKPLPTSGTVDANGNYVIVRLEKVTDGKPAEITREQRNTFMKEIEAAQGIVDYDLYIQGLMRYARVKNNMANIE